MDSNFLLMRDDTYASCIIRLREVSHSLVAAVLDEIAVRVQLYGRKLRLLTDVFSARSERVTRGEEKSATRTMCRAHTASPFIVSFGLVNHR